MFDKLIAYNINIFGKKSKEMVEHNSILFEDRHYGVVLTLPSKKGCGKEEEACPPIPPFPPLTFPSAQLPSPIGMRTHGRIQPNQITI